jgi:hypothetical protein
LYRLSPIRSLVYMFLFVWFCPVLSNPSLLTAAVLGL